MEFRQERQKISKFDNCTNIAAISSIDLFNALKDKVGEKEAKMLTEFIEYNAVDALDKAKSQLATKDDVLKAGIATKDDIYRSERALKEDFSRLEKSTREEISKFEKSFREDISRLDTKIAETKADLLKWMIVLFAPFYIGMIVFLIKQFLH